MSFQSFVLLSILLLQCSVNAATIHAPARHTHFTKRSTLQNNGNGPCITASSNKDGAPVVVGSCSSPNAQWTLPSSGSGMIHIFGNKCLDVTDGANKNGQKLQIWTCNNGVNQKFALTNGELQWKGSDKCLDLTDGKTTSGTPIQLWQCSGGNKNQKWSNPASSGSSSSGSSSTTKSSPSAKNIFPSKLGLAYPDGDLTELLRFTPAKTFYNWNPSIGSLSTAVNDHGNVFLPMLWGWKDKAAFDKIAKTSNAPLFLGMNEVNEPGQANMSPESGIDLWRQSMKPLRDAGKKVCSPSSSGNPNGIPWMQTFTSKCGKDCEFDYLCVHWYDTTFEKFKAWVEKWHSVYPNVPILVTEFAPQNFNGGAQPSSGQVWSFYQQAIPWAFSQDYIHAVFPYGFMRNLNINGNARLLNSDGTPNALGKWILSQA